MMLARLFEFEQRHESTPVLYTERALRYVVDLDMEGKPVGKTPVDLSDPSEPSLTGGKRYPLPTIQRSSAIKPILLADKADYTLGPSPGEKHPKKRSRAEEAHRAYRQLVEDAATSTGSPELTAVLKFLDSDPRSLLELPDDFDEGGTISFRIAGRYLVDLPETQQYWGKAVQSEDPHVMQCLVGGETKAVLDRLQLKIKGLPRGQTAGT